MVLCSRPECQTTAGCKCAQPGVTVPADYQRGWDDCYAHVLKVLSERFTIPAKQ